MMAYLKRDDFQHVNITLDQLFSIAAELRFKRIKHDEEIPASSCTTEFSILMMFQYRGENLVRTIIRILLTTSNIARGEG